MAYASFHALEAKLRKIGFLEKYRELMRTAVELGHITPSSTKGSYIMTHHVVFKKDSDKPRVVYNASLKDKNRFSLNDTLYNGENLQRDLTYVIICFRLFRYALTADIKAMYTNIALSKESASKLRILIRLEEDGPIIECELSRLPFGLNVSPYFAIRCLRELANELPEDVRYLILIYVLLYCFYMDDLLSGSETLEGCIQLKTDLTNLLAKGQFPLTKFVSNSPEVVQPINNEELSLCSEEHKVLGMFWNPKDMTSSSSKSRSLLELSLKEIH